MSTFANPCEPPLSPGLAPRTRGNPLTAARRRQESRKRISLASRVTTGRPNFSLDNVRRNGKRDQADQRPQPPRAQREDCEAVCPSDCPSSGQRRVLADAFCRWRQFPAPHPIQAITNPLSPLDSESKSLVLSPSATPTRKPPSPWASRSATKMSSLFNLQRPAMSTRG